jgi:hypothetical protein
VKAAPSPVDMKKLFITISLVLPLALTALPVFAANTFTPTAYNDGATVATANYDFAIATFNPNGTIYTEHCSSGHSPDFTLFCDGQNAITGAIVNTFIGSAATFRVVEFETSDGAFNCWAANSYATCAAQGRSHTFTVTYTPPVPPPVQAAAMPGSLALPSSSAYALVASVSNVVGGVGLLAVIVLAMAITFFFWFAKEAIALSRQKK